MGFFKTSIFQTHNIFWFLLLYTDAHKPARRELCIAAVLFPAAWLIMWPLSCFLTRMSTCDTYPWARIWTWILCRVTQVALPAGPPSVAALPSAVEWSQRSTGSRMEPVSLRCVSCSFPLDNMDIMLAKSNFIGLLPQHHAEAQMIRYTSPSSARGLLWLQEHCSLRPPVTGRSPALSGPQVQGGALLSQALGYRDSWRLWQTSGPTSKARPAFWLWVSTVYCP